MRGLGRGQFAVEPLEDGANARPDGVRCNLKKLHGLSGYLRASRDFGNGDTRGKPGHSFFTDSSHFPRLAASDRTSKRANGSGAKLRARSSSSYPPRARVDAYEPRYLVDDAHFDGGIGRGVEGLATEPRFYYREA